LDYYADRRAPVRIADLRKYVYGYGPNGFTREVRRLQDGDPLGYVEVDLGRDSSLWGLSHLERLYGADWDRSFIRERHRANTHRSLVAGTALNADVVGGVPKLKTHSKVGITVNLKNLVGIIGDKNWLAHYRIGAPSEGGDEYPPFASHWQ